MKRNVSLVLVLLALVVMTGVLFACASDTPEPRAMAQPYYSGSFRVQDYMRYVPDATTYTTHTSVALTPAGDYAYKSFSPATTILVTVTNIVSTGATSGDLLVLSNMGAGTVTVQDGADVQSTGEVALGQYDTMWFIYDSGEWIELGASNN